MVSVVRLSTITKTSCESWATRIVYASKRKRLRWTRLIVLAFITPSAHEKKNNTRTHTRIAESQKKGLVRLGDYHIYKYSPFPLPSLTLSTCWILKFGRVQEWCWLLKFGRVQEWCWWLWLNELVQPRLSSKRRLFSYGKIPVETSFWVGVL